MGEEVPRKLRRRFFPNNKTITNIVAGVKLENRYSKFDQENLMELKSKWECDAKIKFFPKGSQPKLEDIVNQLHSEIDSFEWDAADEIPLGSSSISDENKLVFVYQSSNMQRLYRKYGNHLVLLDATHKICKYALPLFFLVVQTNVNFQLAAIIVLEDESSSLIIKALEIIKKWNLA